MSSVIDFVLHADDKVYELIRQHGTGTYLILAAVIFGETGLVVLPFLPGDSLLFAVGIFCHPSRHGLSLPIVIGVLSAAAFLGDNLNYQIGLRLGKRLFKNEKSRFFKRSYLDKTHAYFERYGGWTLVLARFVPIVRTFAPFVAGMGNMPFHRFLSFSAAGGFFWVTACTVAGYYFGQIPAVADNFELMILGIVVLSVIPFAIKLWMVRRGKKAG